MSASGKAFAYVLQQQQPQRICFGSGRHRDTTGQDPSPFMRYYILDNNLKVGPTTYNVLESVKATITKPCNHSISKRGYSGIARFARLPTAPIEIVKVPLVVVKDSSPIKPAKKVADYSFGSRSERKLLFGNTNPGPGMYNPDHKPRSMEFEHSFGGRIKMKLGTDLKCCSRNVDTCTICGKVSPGDYWHLDDKVYLCKNCMDEELLKQTTYTRKELNRFRKLRDCSHIHRHEGTNAKTWIIHPKNAAQWARREAYISTYIKW